MSVNDAASSSCAQRIRYVHGTDTICCASCAAFAKRDTVELRAGFPGLSSFCFELESRRDSRTHSTYEHGLSSDAINIYEVEGT